MQSISFAFFKAFAKHAFKAFFKAFAKHAFKAFFKAFAKHFFMQRYIVSRNLCVIAKTK